MVACPVSTPEQIIAYIFSLATKLRRDQNANVDQSEIFTHDNAKVDNAPYGSRE